MIFYILHVFETNYKINFTIFHFYLAFLKIYFFSNYYPINYFFFFFTEKKAQNQGIAALLLCHDFSEYSVFPSAAGNYLGSLFPGLYIATGFLAADQLIAFFHHIAAAFRTFL